MDLPIFVRSIGSNRRGSARLLSAPGDVDLLVWVGGLMAPSSGRRFSLRYVSIYPVSQTLGGWQTDRRTCDQSMDLKMSIRPGAPGSPGALPLELVGRLCSVPTIRCKPASLPPWQGPTVSQFTNRYGTSKSKKASFTASSGVAIDDCWHHPPGRCSAAETPSARGPGQPG